MLKPPKPDPALDPFRGGVAVLRRDGEVAGHVATEVKTFWSPFSFSRHRQWWVWFIVVWTNGDREPSAGDYRLGPSFEKCWPGRSPGTRRTRTTATTRLNGCRRKRS